MNAKIYKVANPATLFVAGQRVENGAVRLTPDQARYDLMAGVLIDPDAAVTEPAAKAGEAPRRKPAEG